MCVLLFICHKYCQNPYTHWKAVSDRTETERSQHKWWIVGVKSRSLFVESMLEWWRQNQNKTKMQLCKNTEMQCIAYSLVWFMFGVWSLHFTLLIFEMWRSMLHWTWAIEPGYGDKAPARCLSSPLFFSKWFVLVSMREYFWALIYTFACGMEWREIALLTKPGDW